VGKERFALSSGKGWVRGCGSSFTGREGMRVMLPVFYIVVDGGKRGGYPFREGGERKGGQNVVG